MKTTIALFLLLPTAAVSVRPVIAQTPAQRDAAIEKPLRAELALGYSFLRSNAPPGGCGCFNLNGGRATFAWRVKPAQFALVGDVTVAHSGAISNSGEDLTLSTFAAGMRYKPQLGHTRLQPYGQALAGLAHSSGSLVQGSNPGAANAGAAFAAHVGGGLDLRANHRFSVRLVEADYLLTTFDNGSNNHQNSLSLGAGIVVRFSNR
jgi:peptidoglycan-associated lipoprotein